MKVSRSLGPRACRTLAALHGRGEARLALASLKLVVLLHARAEGPLMMRARHQPFRLLIIPYACWPSQDFDASVTFSDAAGPVFSP